MRITEEDQQRWRGVAAEQPNTERHPALSRATK